jgi:hypothetical protein
MVEVNLVKNYKSILTRRTATDYLMKRPNVIGRKVGKLLVPLKSGTIETSYPIRAFLRLKSDIRIDTTTAGEITQSPSDGMIRLAPPEDTLIAGNHKAS